MEIMKMPKAENAQRGEVLTRTTDRVRNLAEVFTGSREVNAMLDLVGDYSYNIDARFLEPSCGNGNFLSEIYSRKLRTVSERSKDQIEFEYLSIKALTSIYGVDIDPDNITEAKFRLLEIVIDHYSKKLNTGQRSQNFDRAISKVLDTNIFVGDMINGLSSIEFVEYSSIKPPKFSWRRYRYVDLLEAVTGSLWADAADPIDEHRSINYWEIA